MTVKGRAFVSGIKKDHYYYWSSCVCGMMQLTDDPEHWYNRSCVLLGNIPSLSSFCSFWSIHSFIIHLKLGDSTFSLLIFLVLLPEVLLGSETHHLGKGDQLAKDEPVVDHLGGGGGGQALHLADENRRHH